jgi:RND family efflux transporter MFP subunit
MSAPLQGMLVEVLVKGGDQVKKGQILTMMDNRIAKAAVNAARAAADRTAQVDHSKHALALARSFFARHSSLQEAQAGAEFELEQARAQRDQAEATLASALESQLQAKRDLELEEARLEAHNIRAPFDGEVVRIEATVGTTLTPSDKLLTIVCLDSLEAELHLPLELFGELQPGESYRLWAFAPVNGPIRARLAFASPVIDMASKTFRCLFTIDNRARQFPAGFSVRFDLSHPKSYREDSL